MFLWSNFWIFKSCRQSKAWSLCWPSIINKQKQKNQNGTHQANRPQEHRLQSSQEAASLEICTQNCKCYWQRYQEASQIQTRYSRPSWDQKVSEIDRVANTQAAFPEACQRDCYRVQEWFEIPITGSFCNSGGLWSLHGRALWRHQSVCHSRQESHYYAQRYSACQTHPRWEVLNK